ncbi:MAG: DNA repair protein RecO [Candidatus Nealsonbacteria bacterium CG_4_9_14_0_2_um_filter_37_38]|uniref:DNA repair protein RecO n=1 Tax=Candidatus Nealsonbacteria bacterium CG_4_10_14_0_8_um_filter_37_14 TaxID=1974684 RepID=A0A2M7R6Q6_9BACT|nr:MAG: DNA repair protein RecO [Candidatus Nealsonbacteria bacterium CG11_big_fil_rev_8_21_14_0_20_37_68]PIW92078.1 MAG: DNA repair protein RecO [Candidatus Nealsonbacteria bacterium CG_4_8_14_3_um_filter_37_23]PIY88895.1 MAG: DNA repair protein RecO [Candidatus Nealsonbacteria bacterium CG_4_10_14_0_8_um_filter_37_14]PJC51564.1 MAG: DNA repair protein RecO [Candidatus Nealsonbacteria bacterium CG_4_9_14_0_2_um_filter_37_38]
MFVHYQTKGFVLKKIDRGEADQIFTVFTKDFGKLNFLAKAVRKIKSKLRGGLKLFSLSQLKFIQGKTHKTLTDTETCQSFDGVSKSLIKLKVAHKIAEVLDNLIKEKEEDRKIWSLLNETFKELNNCLPVTNYCLLIYYYFFWNLINLIGYRPSVYNCAICQAKLIPEPLYFNSAEGGVICRGCFRKTKSGMSIDSDLVKILRIIFKRNFKELVRLKVKPTHYQSLKKVSDDYYSYLTKEL